jgi:hypothetical protein
VEGLLCEQVFPLLLLSPSFIHAPKKQMSRTHTRERKAAPTATASILTNMHGSVEGRNVPMQFTDAAQTKGINALLPPGLIESGVAVFRKERSFLAMIIGIPNTGKSTLINALRRTGFKTKQVSGPNLSYFATWLVAFSRLWLTWCGFASVQGKTRTNAAATGARPGLTRHVSVLQYYDDPPAYLIDTPGVMNPRKENGEVLSPLFLLILSLSLSLSLSVCLSVCLSVSSPPFLSLSLSLCLSRNFPAILAIFSRFLLSRRLY